jgi:hypothetical protein
MPQMQTTELQYNSPIKNCRTCAHVKMDCYPADDFCCRLGCYCRVAASYCKMDRWQPKPPRRSLRRWLYDLILK